MIDALLLAARLAALPSRAENRWGASLPQALSAAKAAHQPVLADFTAPWCYSCYYMEKNVFQHPRFWELARGWALVRVDVDQPEGRALKEKLHINFLPSFLVLDGDGKERGRIVGEQREDDFLARLSALAEPGAAPAEDAAAARLTALLQQGDVAAARAFAAKPAGARLEALRARADWRLLELRLALKRAPTPKNLEALVAADDGCDLAYDLEGALKDKPGKAFASARAKLEAWAERRYWVPPDRRCADFRSGVEAMSDYYEAIGDASAKAELLDRAASLTAAESDRQGVGQDRNLDDNRRFFLELAGRDAELEALFPRLINAYAADYVYAHRFAKWLAGKKRAADALPWAEKADLLCYGANRLAVTQVRAEILDALGRRPEARALLQRDVKANRAALPRETRPLEDLLASWRGAAKTGRK